VAERAGGLGREIAPPILGHVCLHASMAGTRLAAPLFALSMGYSKAATGALVALFALTQIFLSLPAGRYADRNGLKRIASRCVVVTTLGIAAAAIWPVYPVLCLTALACGGAVGAVTIALQRHVGRAARSPGELKQAFSWLSMAPASSNFVGPMLAGFLIDHAGYRAAFAVLAVLPLAGWIFIRRAHEHLAAPVAAPKAGTAWDLLSGTRMRRLLLMNWFMTASWDFHSFMVPLLGHERGMSASAIGSVLGAFAASAALVRLSLPVLAERVRDWALITGAIAIAGVTLLAYPFTASAATMAVCSALLGATLGAVTPTVLSMLHQITPAHRQGEALAVRSIMVNASSLAIPLLLGAAGGIIGLSGVFWTWGGTIAVGSRFGLGLRGPAAGEAKTRE
jgi:MFS family permease